ncbi:hypothetical protein RIF29_34342 [Crotalaria pallida]|uniref:Remorin C-terminal domain-containing protein n=1 Tax=Crotalaria pallida TaxID=3830 RepID=A0AAN9HTH5_CROPI
MGEDENGNTEPHPQSEALVARPSSSSAPTPLDQSPLNKGEESNIPHITNSNDAGQECSLMSLVTSPNPKQHDAMHAKVEEEKRLALIKAWEENEKTKVENRAYKRQFAIGFWKDTKKAYVEAKIKKFEEKLERKKAEYIEKMQNKIAEIHLIAEEKKATITAKREEELLEVEEIAAKFRSSDGYSPRKLFPCFGG